MSTRVITIPNDWELANLAAAFDDVVLPVLKRKVGLDFDSLGGGCTERGGCEFAVWADLPPEEKTEEVTALVAVIEVTWKVVRHGFVGEVLRHEGNAIARKLEQSRKALA